MSAFLLAPGQAIHICGIDPIAAGVIDVGYNARLRQTAQRKILPEARQAGFSGPVFLMKPPRDFLQAITVFQKSSGIGAGKTYADRSRLACMVGIPSLFKRHAAGKGNIPVAGTVDHKAGFYGLGSLFGLDNDRFYTANSWGCVRPAAGSA